MNGPQRTGTPPPDKRGRGRLSMLARPTSILLALTVLMLGALLALNGVTNSLIRSEVAPKPESASDVPLSILHGGPIIAGTPQGLRSVGMPPKTVALTFDDGPDPQWTPRILDVLRKYHVPATFFVVGAVAAKHPDLLRAERDQGSALGVHTFTHIDLASASDLRVRSELGETQFVLNGAVGESAVMLRPPFSATVRAIDNPHFAALQRTTAQGYVTVVTDVDSEDWRHPGADAIVANSTPHGDQGAVILMHDAGGDRSQTVAALDRLIPNLLARGYRFTNPMQAIGLSPNTPVRPYGRMLGLAFLGAVVVAGYVVAALTWMLLVVGALILLRMLLMISIALGHRLRRGAKNFRWGPTVTDPVSVIVPAYNERENIAATIRSLAASDHPVEIIVVDDGSTDETADIAESLGLPNVRVVRKPNGGKPSALNAGIAHARHELLVMIDGDTVFAKDTVRKLVQPFADPYVGAVSGNAKVAGSGRRGRRGLIASWQHIEYVIGFNVDRRFYDVMRCMPTVPGAVGAFRRSALLYVGGVSEDTLAEDTDLTMALCRVGWRVVYEPAALAWTEAPATLTQLWRQRYRWSYGTMQAMWKHRRAILERGRAGRFGRVGLAHLAAFQVLLPLLAPLVDVFLLYGLAFLDPVATVCAWAGMLGVQLLGAVFAFRLERERIGVLLLLPLQQLVYRPLMYAVLVRSMVTAIAGIRLRWQKLKRVGGLDNLVSAPAQQQLPRR